MSNVKFNVKFFTYTRTALKNLFSKPATKEYPFIPAQFPQRMRGHVAIEIEKCISCGICARSCPPGAIQVDRTAGTWTIYRFDCVQCGNCTNVCPKKCLEMVPGYTEPQAQKSSETFTRPAPSASPDAVPKAVGKPVNDTSKCVFCTLCAKKCPQEAIAVDRAAKTWTLEEEKCVACGICVSSCPKKCLQMKSC